MSVASSSSCLPPPASFRRLLSPAASCLFSSSSSPDLNHDHPCPVFPAGPQPRSSTPSVPCRTSTTIIHASVPCRTSTATIPAQCSLPDLNRDHPRPVFPAGPQPRSSTPSVPCRTSTTIIHGSVPCRTSTAGIHAKCSLPDLMRYAR